MLMAWVLSAHKYIYTYLAVAFMGNRFILLSILLFACGVSMAQDDPYIKVKGKVYDPKDAGSQFNLMVLNQTELHGIFGEKDGSFIINCRKNDSLSINVVGYKTVGISFRDSVKKDIYTIKIPLQQIEYELKPVSVFTKRDLNAIQEDIQKLGYNEKDYVTSGVDAIQSPITFLYQTFSKRERSRRKVAELENEDRKRELLKELFRRYIDADIIYLNDEEFDDFIDFCRVPEDFMKRSTQYEFCVYIKARYYEYRRRR